MISQGRVITNHIIGYAETQIDLSNSACKIIEEFFSELILITMKINL